MFRPRQDLLIACCLQSNGKSLAETTPLSNDCLAIFDNIPLHAIINIKQYEETAMSGTMTRMQKKELVKNFFTMLQSYGPGCVEDLEAVLCGEKKEFTVLYGARIRADLKLFGLDAHTLSRKLA